MKIDKRSKLERCAAREDREFGKYAMSALYLDTQDEGKPVVVTTNGRVLAVVPVELEEGDKAGAIPVEALKEARRGAVDGKACIEVKNALTVWTKAGPITYQRPDVGKFPDWREVSKDRPDGLSVCLNAKLLLDLAQAFGTDSVRITFAEKDGPNLPFRVEPIGDGIDGAHGVIMPISGL